MVQFKWLTHLPLLCESSNHRLIITTENQKTQSDFVSYTAVPHCTGFVTGHFLCTTVCNVNSSVGYKPPQNQQAAQQHQPYQPTSSPPNNTMHTADTAAAAAPCWSTVIFVVFSSLLDLMSLAPSSQKVSEESALRQLAGSEADNDEGDLARAESATATASAMSELATVLQQQGKLSESEELFR